MATYIKKPIQVHTEQWFPNKTVDGVIPATELPNYTVEQICISLGFHVMFDLSSYGWIETLEGGHVVQSGDWIITGIKGEKYPCKPDIFEATYDLVEGAT